MAGLNLTFDSPTQHCIHLFQDISLEGEEGLCIWEGFPNRLPYHREYLDSCGEVVAVAVVLVQAGTLNGIDLPAGESSGTHRILRQDGVKLLDYYSPPSPY